jgi:hypothetical protein
VEFLPTQQLLLVRRRKGSVRHTPALLGDHHSLYVRFLKDIAQAPPPYQVEAGIVGVPGWKLEPIRASSGEMDKGDVILQGTLKDDSEEEQHKFLLAFFQEVFNQAGLDRPLNLHNFPGRRQ